MFSNIFGKENNDSKKVVTVFKLLNDTGATFYNWNGKLYDNSIIRTAIGTNGIHAGKLNPKHVRILENDIQVSPNNNIKNILKKPNKYMTMYDFIQKMMIQRESNNNSFAYIDRDKNVPGMNGIKGIYPLNFSSVELLEDDDGNLFCKFRFRNGQYKIVPYEDVIHIRKHFNEDDFWGESNKIALNDNLNVISTTKQGIKNAIKNTAFIRGILEFKQVLQQEDIDKQVKDFSDSFNTH